MVERLDVEFRSEGVTCRAWFYRVDEAGPRPTVWAMILEDRNLRYEKPGQRLYLPHATENSEAEVSSWPFPETVRTFMAIKAKEAPLYENKSTVESVDLLMNYDVGPFVKRIYNTPTFMIVAEGDDLTLWDLEINAFNAVPSARKKLHVLPYTSHMTLYWALRRWRPQLSSRRNGSQRRSKDS